jgi:hypothetical protein
MKRVSKYNIQRYLKYATEDNQEIKRHIDKLNLCL